MHISANTIGFLKDMRKRYVRKPCYTTPFYLEQDIPSVMSYSHYNIISLHLLLIYTYC